ncbi:MAG: transglycosylase domain-containing protein [Beutenbergiaceae bacterium]
MAGSTRARGRTVNIAQLISLFVVFLMVAGVGGALSAGFAMPMVAAVGAATSAGAQTFDDLETEIGDMTLSERSVIRYADGTQMATFYAEDRIVVPLDEIAPVMRQAVVAVEDRRFYEHGAIDPEGLLRAIVQNITNPDSTQGGSTLTQQYVKNVLLEQARIQQDAEAIYAATAGTIGRKLREAKLAIALERVYSKDQILEGYLNVAQFGPSQWGVEAASRYFFSVSAAELNIGQAAMLAGITQLPNTWNPITNPEGTFDRRNTVLMLMLREDMITQEDFDTYSAIPVEEMLNVQAIPPTCATAEISAYFCNFVVETILQSPEYGETRADRYQLLVRGGLDITTTINPALQAEGFAALTAAVPVDDPSGVSNAISTVEPGTGRILAMVQNTHYGKPGDDLDRTTEVNFNADADYGGSLGFQTGSTFKAIVLAAWLEAGNSLMDIVDGTQGQSFPRSSWNYSGCDLGQFASTYDPKNIEGIGNGPMTVIHATEQSVNTAFVDMANKLNMCDLYNLTQRLGMHVGSGVDATYGLPLVPSPAMVLGSNNIAPLTMAAAFATFAASGTYCTPVAIHSVLDQNGNALPIPSAGCYEAIKPEIAATVTYALSRVVTTNGATGNRANLADRVEAGKTGTANSDTAAWFVGYVPQAATAVWNGFSEGLRPMMNITINGQRYGQVYGGRFAAPIWHDYMSDAVNIMGLEPAGFPDPNERLVYGERKWVPNVAGMSVDQATQTLQEAGFMVQVGEAQEDAAIPQGAVVRSQPATGSLVQQGSGITLITSAGPPAAAPSVPDPCMVDPTAPGCDDG